MQRWAYNVALPVPLIEEHIERVIRIQKERINIMIRLATVFSGIGAIEHALQRMQIKNEIVFACDNGDVSILTKKIDMNIDEIGNELKSLSKIIKKIKFNNEVEDLYKNQLDGMLTEALNEYESVLYKLDSFPKQDTELVKKILQNVISMKGVKASRIKEYKKFLDELGQGSEQQAKLRELQVILEVSNDYKKDNSLDDLGKDIEFESGDDIDWRSISELVYSAYEKLESLEGKKIIRKVQDLSQRASQLHEKINYMAVQKKLEGMGEDWAARKKYVDSLYEGMEKRNKVKLSYMANYNIKDEQLHWNVAGQVDLFVGGSPCQSFSLVGKQRGLDDTRGTLFYEYARLIDEIKPKVFIYENVKAVTTHDGGRTWKKMQQVFSELGYKFTWSILNSKNFGIPQNRERFGIGKRL